MTANNGDARHKHQTSVNDPDPHQGTILDRIKMPPMSGEEALRRFGEQHASQTGSENNSQSRELENLHPMMKVVALGGTLFLIVSVLLCVLYFLAA